MMLNSKAKSIENEFESKGRALSKPEENVPTIGILTQPLGSEYKQYGAYSTILSFYVYWLEQAGANVIAVPYNLKDENLAALMTQINGLLLPGGHILSTQDSLYPFYEKKVNYIIDLAKKINDDGTFFPLFGTCMGYLQIINNLTNWRGDLFVARNWEQSRKLHFVKGFSSNGESNARDIFVPKDIKNYEKEKLTYFNDKFAISYDSFMSNSFYTDNFNPVAFYYKRHVKLLAMVEAKNYPFIATQFHPEKIINTVHLHKLYKKLPKSQDAKQEAQKMARGLMKMAQKNDNKFESPEIQKKLMMNTEVSIPSLLVKFGPRYIFNRKSNKYYFLKKIARKIAADK